MDTRTQKGLPFSIIWEREENKEKFLKQNRKNDLRTRKRRFQSWRKRGRTRGLPKRVGNIIEQIKWQMSDWLKRICAIDADEVLRQTKIMPVSKKGAEVIFKSMIKHVRLKGFAGMGDSIEKTLIIDISVFDEDDIDGFFHQVIIHEYLHILCAPQLATGLEIVAKRRSCFVDFSPLTDSSWQKAVYYQKKFTGVVSFGFNPRLTEEKNFFSLNEFFTEIFAFVILFGIDKQMLLHQFHDHAYLRGTVFLGMLLEKLAEKMKKPIEDLILLFLRHYLYSDISIFRLITKAFGRQALFALMGKNVSNGYATIGKDYFGIDEREYRQKIENYLAGKPIRLIWDVYIKANT